MSDTTLTPDAPPDTPEGDEPKPSDLRKAASEGQAAKLENARLARENAMLRAGVDDSTPTGKFFVDSYQGPPDVEAIKAQASSMGILREQTTATPAETNPVTPEEAAGFAAAAEASSGASAPDALGDEHPNDRAYKVFMETKKSSPAPVAAAKGVQEIIDAGFRGDKRVLWDRRAHQEAAREFAELEGE